jgi:hypothetical protein
VISDIDWQLYTLSLQEANMGSFTIYYLLLFISHEFAKQENTIHFDSGTKIAITQSILNGFA